jgi:hypothetical protein
VTFHRIIGAVLLYLNVGLIFTALFCFVALRIPNAFTGLGPLQDNLAVAGDLLYFSFVTLTSVGYGDIAPLHPYARGLANVEAIIGQLYPVTLPARSAIYKVLPFRLLRLFGRPNLRGANWLRHAVENDYSLTTTTGRERFGRYTVAAVNVLPVVRYPDVARRIDVNIDLHL